MEILQGQTAGVRVTGQLFISKRSNFFFATNDEVRLLNFIGKKSLLVERISTFKIPTLFVLMRQWVVKRWPKSLDDTKVATISCGFEKSIYKI